MRLPLFVNVCVKVRNGVSSVTLSGYANYLSELANPVHFRSSHVENSISFRPYSSSLVETGRKLTDLTFFLPTTESGFFQQQHRNILKISTSNQLLGTL